MKRYLAAFIILLTVFIFMTAFDFFGLSNRRYIMYFLLFAILCCAAILIFEIKSSLSKKNTEKADKEFYAMLCGYRDKLADLETKLRKFYSSEDDKYKIFEEDIEYCKSVIKPFADFSRMNSLKFFSKKCSIPLIKKYGENIKEIHLGVLLLEKFEENLHSFDKNDEELREINIDGINMYVNIAHSGGFFGKFFALFDTVKSDFEKPLY